MEERKNSKAGAIIAIVALVAVIAIAWLAYSAISANAAGDAEGQSIAGAASAEDDAHWNNPALSSLTITDSDGYPITMGTLCDGKVTVVNVWASWCPYCIDEMKDYQGLYEKYGSKVQFVMLDTAESDQEVEAARDYVKEQGFTFPVFYDTNQELLQFFSVAAYPTTVVIGSDGEVLLNRPGRIVTESLDKALADLTNPPAA